MKLQGRQSNFISKGAEIDLKKIRKLKHPIEDTMSVLQASCMKMSGNVDNLIPRHV